MNKYKNLMQFSATADKVRSILDKLSAKASNAAYTAEKQAAYLRAAANRAALYAAADQARAASLRLDAQRKAFNEEATAIKRTHPAFTEA